MMRCVPQFVWRTPHAFPSSAWWGEDSPNRSFSRRSCSRRPEGRVTRKADLEGDSVLFPVQERSYFSTQERGVLPWSMIHLVLSPPQEEGLDCADSFGYVCFCPENVTCHLLLKNSVKVCRDLWSKIFTWNKKNFSSDEDFYLLKARSILFKEDFQLIIADKSFVWVTAIYSIPLLSDWWGVLSGEIIYVSQKREMVFWTGSIGSNIGD